MSQLYQRQLIKSNYFTGKFLLSVPNKALRFVPEKPLICANDIVIYS